VRELARRSVAAFEPIGNQARGAEAMMGIAAVCVWGLTALAGLVLFGTWVAKGGVRRGAGQHGKHRRLPRTLVFGHVGLAIVGLLVWIAYLTIGQGMLIWAAVGVVAVVAVLGLVMFARWVPSYRGRARFGTGPGAAHRMPATGRWALPEHHFPVIVVAAHGLLAVATVALVVLTALSIG
jgi:hypothetical protein